MVSRRMRMVLAATIAGLVAAVAAIPATALDESVSGFALGGGGRGWDFTNAPFGVGDGSVAIPGRVGDDGFDNQSLQFELEAGDGTPGVPYLDPDGIGNFSAKNNSFSLSPQASVHGLRVSRTETAHGPYLRSLIKIENPNTAVEQVIGRWTADFGSDGAEVTQSSSSGDKSFSKADRWIVSSQPGADAVDDDPVLAFALLGKGVDKKKLDYIPLQGPGQGLLTIFYDVRVPAGATRYMLFFTEMHATPGQAKTSMSKYDKQGLSKSLLEGIGKKARSQVVNWDL